MGLDMYLIRKTYVKNWSHQPKKSEYWNITVTRGVGHSIKPERISYITEEIGYWRKANAIHNWFVKNVQDGHDDCKEYWVSKEQLDGLLSTVKYLLEHIKLVDGETVNGQTLINGKWVDNKEKGKVVEDPRLCIELLPTQSGFFFGCTDYDEYYVQDLMHTKEILESIDQEDKHWGDYVYMGDLYYQASW